MLCHSGQRKVYWQNLREEPLVFINGQPFVVRESDQPFSNLEYTGEAVKGWSRGVRGWVLGSRMAARRLMLLRCSAHPVLLYSC